MGTKAWWCALRGDGMSYMKQALALARQALGTTSPNPAVGAVVVKDNRTLGEGYTQPPGQSHAEVVALEHCGDSARGASMYVTLEPCCVYGRTPPCTEAIIAAGIREVYAARLDPNPRVDGKGLAQLAAAGVRVHSGEGEEQAEQLYEAFAKHVRTGLPFVTAKFAMSLDGKIATHTGDSKWVTGPDARAYVHEMRRTSDAIIVGVNTVLRDDPQLTARDRGGNPLGTQALRVILDSLARTPQDARIFGEPGHTLVSVAGAEGERMDRLRDAGAEVLELPADEAGMVDPGALLQNLGQRGVVSVLVEGGGILMGSLFDLDLVDKVAAFIAPVIVGGSSAPSPVGGTGAGTIAHSIKLDRAVTERFGDDILVVGYPSRDPEESGEV